MIIIVTQIKQTSQKAIRTIGNPIHIIVSWITQKIRAVYDWMGTFVHSPYATVLLALFFFIEAIFFLPTDPLLILFCVERQKRAFYYATIATLFSVLGGITAYFIGLLVWATVGNFLITLFTSPETFARLCEQYKLYQNWAVLIAGFTPIPFKAVTLTAGFCKLPLIPFIICSTIARGARFYLIAATATWWGKALKQAIDTHFNKLVGIFIILVALSLWVLK